LDALRRLDQHAKLLERCASNFVVEDLIAAEREAAHSYGGRSVFGRARPPQT
jgi:hypothetical protein